MSSPDRWFWPNLQSLFFLAKQEYHRVFVCPYSKTRQYWPSDGKSWPEMNCTKSRGVTGVWTHVSDVRAESFHGMPRRGSNWTAWLDCCKCMTHRERTAAKDECSEPFKASLPLQLCVTSHIRATAVTKWPAYRRRCRCLGTRLCRWWRWTANGIWWKERHVEMTSLPLLEGAHPGCNLTLSFPSSKSTFFQCLHV